jgi:hypothetical protein
MMSLPHAKLATVATVAIVANPIASARFMRRRPCADRRSLRRQRMRQLPCAAGGDAKATHLILDKGLKGPRIFTCDDCDVKIPAISDQLS